jgi:hypothetical protein
MIIVRTSKAPTNRAAIVMTAEIVVIMVTVATGHVSGATTSASAAGFTRNSRVAVALAT